MRLSPAQVKHFETFGYLVLRGWLPPEVMRMVVAEAQQALVRSYGDQPVDEGREQATLTMGDDTPLLAAALEQLPFLTPARQLYGDDALGIATYATSHVGNTGWHVDSPHAFPRGVKLSIYLDATFAERGALRVLPGSHREELHQATRAWLRDPQRDCDDWQVPAVVCPSAPGDVVVFDLRLFHAALGGHNDRRVVNLFYYENPVTPEDVRRTREQIAEDFEWLADKNRADARVFSADWLANAPGSETRARWIQRFEEMGFFDGDAERSGRSAARSLGQDMETQIEALLEPGWALLRTTAKRELARIVARCPAGEVTVLVRPADDPHPRYKVIDGLAYCYSTLDCRELRDEQLEEFERLVDRVHASLSERLEQAMT